MLIRELHPATDPADVAAIQPVAQAGYAAAMANFPNVSVARVAMAADDLIDSTTFVLGAFADAADTVALGYASLRIETVGNLDLAYGELWVTPEARRRGIGSALHAAALRKGAEHGRTRLNWEGPSSADPHLFAAKLGGKEVEKMTRNVLDLRAVDRDEFAALAAPSPANAAYTLTQWVDRCPAELVESYCAANDAMGDAPTGESGYEHQQFTPERLTSYEEGSIKFGVRRYVVAALAADGTVAGFTSIAWRPGEPRTLEIWTTGVARTHRGHGLGLRVKAAATLWLMAEYPDAYWLDTYNNSDNEPMLRVNRELGYQRSEDWIGYEFPIAA